MRALTKQPRARHVSAEGEVAGDVDIRADPTTTAALAPMVAGERRLLAENGWYRCVARVIARMWAPI